MKLPNTTERIILGIDPGTTIMGYGVIRVIGQKAEMITLGSVDLHKLTARCTCIREVLMVLRIGLKTRLPAQKQN